MSFQFRTGFDSASGRYELDVSLFRPPAHEQPQLTLGF